MRRKCVQEHCGLESERKIQFFCNLEKSRANAKIMDSIKDVSGQLITGKMNIMSAQRNYFADLYEKKVGGVNMAERIHHFMNNTSVPMLSENQRKRNEVVLLEIISSQCIETNENWFCSVN